MKDPRFKCLPIDLPFMKSKITYYPKHAILRIYHLIKTNLFYNRIFLDKLSFILKLRLNTLQKRVIISGFFQSIVNLPHDFLSAPYQCDIFLHSEYFEPIDQYPPRELQIH